MNHKTKLAFTIALAIGACPVLTHATNGMNSEGTGPKSRGMGGAGVAMANEAQSIINNPAAVTALGNRRDMALGLFSPDERGFEITGNGAIFNQAQTSEKKIFPIPFYGFSKALDDGAAWAFTLSAAGGMNTDYATNFGALAGDPGHTGIDLAQMFFGGTYGAKLSDSTSWGVTVSLAYQQFSAEGLQRFDAAGVTSSVGSVTNKGTDSSTGIGLKVGFLGDLSNGATWGASYQFKTDMSKFDDYKGLFANQGELDIAPTLTLGIAYPIGDGKTLAVDYHYIDYEAVDSISNHTSLFTDGKQFGSTGGPGFGWNSISVIKAGIEVQTASDMIWRGGINVGESPLDESGVEMSTTFLVPGTITTHLTAGFTMTLESGSELTGVFVHSLENCQSGAFSDSFGGGEIESCMEQNFLEVSYGTNF